ncbi:flavodoxin family protein [Chloroflexota bacterium]
MYILAVVGSPRLDGNTNYLVDQALDEATKLGARTEKIIVSEHRLSPCRGHINCSELDSCAQKDDGALLLDKLCEADGVILATPVYYYDVSAWMKIFIDRNFFLRQHGKKCRAKTVGIIVVAGGTKVEDTVQTLNRYVNSSTFNNIAEDKRFVVAGSASGPGDVRSNQQLIREARDMGRQLVMSLKE